MVVCGTLFLFFFILSIHKENTTIWVGLVKK